MELDRGLKKTFGTISAVYDSARASYPDELIEDIVKISKINATSKILEIGCGSGKATYLFAKRGYTILGIDISFELINFARKLQIDLQLIELIPIGKAENIFENYHVDIYQIFEKIKSRYSTSNITIRQDLHYRPIIEIDGIKIEFVKGYCNSLFCKNCRQLRLSSDGTFYTCIYGGLRINALKLIKSRNESELIKKLQELCMLRKPKFCEIENT